MRITMVVNNSFEHDARVLREATALAEAGHELEVIAVRGPRTPASERVGKVAVTRVDSDPLPAKAVRRLAGLLRGRGDRGPVEIGSMGSGATASVPGRFALRLHLRLTQRRFVRHAVGATRASRPDVVVAHDLDTLEAADRAGKAAGARLVYDCHELWLDRSFVPPPTRLARRRWARLERRLIVRAERVVTVSDLFADELVKRYAIPRPTVIRNLPEAPKQVPRRNGMLRGPIGLGEDVKLAVYIGGLMPSRGLEELIEALPLLPRLHAALVGPSQPAHESRLRALARRRGVAERVHVLEPVPPDQVVQMAADADVGIVANLDPGLNHRYTLPNRLFTYLAAGVPVVGNPSPAFGPLIDSEGVGITCDFSDPEQLARAVAALIDRDEEWERVRRNAFEFSRRQNWEAEAARLTALYAELARP